MAACLLARTPLNSVIYTPSSSIRLIIWSRSLFVNCFRCHCFDMEISLTKTQLCKLKLLLCAHKRVWLCMARGLVWAPKGMSRSLSSRLKESLPTPSISLLWTGRGLPRRKYVLLVSNSNATGDDKFCLVHFSIVSLVLISFLYMLLVWCACKEAWH